MTDDSGTAWVAAMKRGDYQTAWRLSDRVRADSDPTTRDDPRLPYHLRWVWDGRPLVGLHVLVRCYHGLGDTLQFARYLPALGHQVASLTVETQPELIPLLETMSGIDRLVGFDPLSPAKPAGCDIEIMELGAALRMEPALLPPPYLQISPGPPNYEDAIGLCWKAGGWNSERSMPASLLVPLTQHSCVSLCPGPTDLRVLNPLGCPAAIIDTARLLKSLRLVITVDTMIAHLAGALNVPTWLLVKHDSDWRWMMDRSDSPWYPSMRLYRQPSPGDWETVIARIVADLNL